MKTKKIVYRLSAFLIALLMMCTLTVTSYAADANEAVKNDTTGVLQVRVVYTDDNNSEETIRWGTGFLVNDDTLITCEHVVIFTDAEYAILAHEWGKTIAEVKDRMSIKITVVRDVTINATIRNSSSEMDFAILELEDRIYDRTYLPLRSSDEVQQTESVYALGFNVETERVQDVQTYTSDDVTITNGQVSKLVTFATVDFIQHNARVLNGNFGGPLVDVNGNVVGICAGITHDGMDVNYSYAISNEQLIKTLSALGIEYTLNSGTIQPPVSTPAPEQNQEPDTQVSVPVVDKTQLQAVISDAQKIEIKNYTETTGEAFAAALTAAQSVSANGNATQSDVNNAITVLTTAQMELEPKVTLPIIPIAVAAVVVILVVVVLIVLLTRKKAPKAAVPMQPGAFTAPINTVNNGFTPGPTASVTETSVLSNAGETTLLSGSAGETTLLGNSASASFGKLIRTKTGENIVINSADFVIGREKSRVNYCVSDNSSVGRTHIRLTSKGGALYVTDLKSTNGTFINGVKQNPNQEVMLNNGDKLTLADEEFVYSTF